MTALYLYYRLLYSRLRALYDYYRVTVSLIDVVEPLQQASVLLDECTVRLLQGVFTPG